MSVVCGEGTSEKRGDWQGFSTSRYNFTLTADVLGPELCRDPAVPSQQERTPWERAETPMSQCCPGTQPVMARETQRTRRCLGKAVQSQWASRA